MSSDRLSRFYKARGDDAIWDRIVAFASTLEPALAAAFLDTVRGARISQQMIVQILNRAGPDVAANEILNRISYRLDTVGRHLSSAIKRAAEKEAKWMEIPIRFNAFAPRAVRAVEAHTLDLVREISESTRESLRSTIARAVQDGINPRETARDLVDFIGLTERQSRAVENYRRALREGRPEALERALRDRRFDRTVLRHLQEDRGLPESMVERLVGRYRERYLQYRAQTIARTESIKALAEAQQLLWAQARDEGLVDQSTLVRRWIVARDERTCPTCSPIPGMNPDGVGVDEPFRTPRGPVYGPPLHPNCRCVIFTRPVVQAR